ncbi:leukocyte elastase inhibitor-like [Leptopilina boulardi]|uniref:leukocyte elastase inhibitor-like n=1 Tax=Leptopilina boulardi TaxID=63433 RepID=UPI0021F57097|nr:leukocyte elastase inhibitor-like [Leptopilina boulardi]
MFLLNPQCVNCKGSCDGIGAILNAETLYQWAKQNIKTSQIFFYNKQQHEKEFRQDSLFSDDLNTDTAMVITNIVYFKGEWKYKFSNPFSFHFINYDNQTILVSNTMYRKAQFKYAHLPHIKAKVIELSYKGDELSMLIVLPDEVHGLDNVEKSLETITLRKLRKELSLTEVALALPKFHVEITNDLNDTLKEMGINQMFMSHANFRGITDRNLYVSKIKQKIVIEVNENGVEDAATTSGFLTNGMMGEHITQQFLANHAFHYKIIRTVGEHDGIALFAGNCKYIQ